MQGFDEKIIFVAGATTDLGWRLLPAFKRANARVILLDHDADDLLEMAARCPGRFEPLPVTQKSSQQFTDIGRIWGAEPLHLLIDLLPIGLREGSDCMIGPSLALIEGLGQGLRAAKGSVISVIPTAAPEDPVAYQVAEAGLCRMAQVLGDQWEPHGVQFNVLRPVAGASAQDMANAISFLAEAAVAQLTGVHVPIRPALH